MSQQTEMFAHIRAQRSGEQTITEYCAAHDLRYAKFHYWQRKFDDARRTEVSTTGFVQLKPAVSSPDKLLCLHLLDGSHLNGSVEQLAAFYRLLKCADDA